MTNTPGESDSDPLPPDESVADDGVAELLAGYALGDLTPEEEQRLQSLSDRSVEQQRADFELTAALVDQSLMRGQTESLPASVRQKILRDANEHFGASGFKPSETDPDLRSTTAESAGLSAREWLAWLCVAASLLIAVGIWRSQPVQLAQADPVAQRSTLMDGAADIVQVAWTPGKTPFDNEVSGDVVWSTEKQEGYMRFVGIPPNNPTQEQYQLWIIDPERDDEPIDGGVFDVSARGEIVVPINAKLAVISPAAFAITIEKPGGVVVSTQDRLPLLAAVN